MTMKRTLCHAALFFVALVVNCCPAIADPTEKQPMQTTQRPVLKNAQDFIEFFRQGGKHYDDQFLTNLMVGNRPDPKAMKALGEELAAGKEDVREKILPLLREIGLIAHPKYELRTPEVIALLVGPALVKADAARPEAMDMLSMYVSPATLSRYGDIFTKVLKEEPEWSVLMLIAKAKPPQAREEVERLSRLPEWNKPDGSNRTAMRIARAALGNTKIEDEFIADAAQKETAGDAEGLAKALHTLARIGTPRSLRAICPRLRSPLIIDLVSAYTKSVRLEAMEALLYAFPEREELYEQVFDREGYIRAEQVCVQKLGFSFAGIPEPVFFTYEGYPSF